MLSDGAGAVQLSNQPNPQGVSLKIHWIDLDFLRQRNARVYVCRGRNS